MYVKSDDSRVLLVHVIRHSILFKTYIDVENLYTHTYIYINIYKYIYILSIEINFYYIISSQDLPHVHYSFFSITVVNNKLFH